MAARCKRFHYTICLIYSIITINDTAGIPLFFFVVVLLVVAFGPFDPTLTFRGFESNRVLDHEVDVSALTSPRPAAASQIDGC